MNAEKPRRTQGPVRGLFARCLAIAIGVHGPALAYMVVTRPSPSKVNAEPTPLEVTLFSREASRDEPDRTRAVLPNETEPPPNAATDSRANPDARFPRAATSAGSASEPTAPVSSNEVPTPPAPSSSASPDSPEERAARARGAVASLFGVGPPPIGALPEGASSPRADDSEKDKAGRILRDSLNEHDRAVGLGNSGPVVAAGQAALSSSTAPSEGIATYQIVTDENGVVTQVRMLEGNGAGWDKLASSLFGNLKGRKLHVAPGSRGASVTLRLEAKYQLPSGAKKYSKELSPTGISGNFDLSDIGAKQVRTISTRVLGESSLLRRVTKRNEAAACARGLAKTTCARIRDSVSSTRCRRTTRTTTASASR